MEEFEIKILYRPSEKGNNTTITAPLHIHVLDAMIALENATKCYQQLVTQTLKRRGVRENVREEIKKLKNKDLYQE